ncbi:TPA: oligosaccharide flippase family protein, partial [Klebsiella pneumoniae]|nr:oligosaccharide flippase family protein [Klebsiella pneumoniae]
SAAVIQQPTVTEILKKTVFTLNVSFGVVVFFLVFFGAPLIASFFNEPLLINVLRLVAFSFPINSATAIHLSLLERDSNFSKIAIVEVASSVFALFIAILFSMNGAGVYSLVAQTLLYSIFSAFGFIFNSSWKIGFAFNYQEIKRIFSFTANLLGFNFLNFFSRNLDQVIIGKNFSAVILGHYSLAYRLMLFPIQNITFVLTRSLYPILSRLQDNPKDSFKTYLHSL